MDHTTTTNNNSRDKKRRQKRFCFDRCVLSCCCIFEWGIIGWERRKFIVCFVFFTLVGGGCINILWIMIRISRMVNKTNYENPRSPPEHEHRNPRQSEWSLVPALSLLTGITSQVRTFFLLLLPLSSIFSWVPYRTHTLFCYFWSCCTASHPSSLHFWLFHRTLYR